MHVKNVCELWRRKRHSRLLSDVLSLYVVQGVNYLIPLLVLPYLLRTLNPMGYGAIVFAQSLVNYLRIFTNFGFNFSATRDVSLARDHREQLGRIFWTTLTAKICLLVIGVAAIAPFILLIPLLRQHANVIDASGLALCGSVLLPEWYFQGTEHIRHLAAIQAASNVVMLVAIFVFVRSPHDEVTAAAILSLPSLLGGGISLLVMSLAWPVSWHCPTVQGVWNALRGSFHLFISGAATSVYVNSNVFLIGIICGDFQVALYSVANRIALAATGVLSPIVQASFPRASVLFHRSVEDGLGFAKTIWRYLFTLAIVMSGVLLIFARQIVEILGGARYLDAIPVVRVMGLLPVAIGTAMVLAQIVMVNVGLTRRMSRIYMIAGVISVALLVPLAYRFGALGGAVSLLAVEIAGPILMARSIVQWLHLRKTERTA